MRRLLTCWLVAGWLCVVAQTVAQDAPVNLDLEAGELGGLPTGWSHPTPAGEVRLTDQEPLQGARCVELTGVEPGELIPFNSLMQMVDAAKYRGQRVWLRAAVRVEVRDAAARAQLWLREDQTERRIGFFDNMGARPIRDPAWHYYDIVGDISTDGLFLNFGLMVYGDATAWLDDVSFTAIGPADSDATKPRPLEGRALDNLVAFAHLFGYVRYFHPSDEAFSTEWDRFAMRGVMDVESAANAEELVARLRALFGPIAPTVQVFLADTPPETTEPATTQPADEPQRVIAWQHYGLGWPDPRPQFYHSNRSVHTVQGSTFPEGVAAPDVPFTADLGGGVTCRVPLSLYCDDEGTLPHAAGDVPTSGPATQPANLLPTASSGDVRSTRLADVIIAWNVMQHFYPYFDVVDTDWPQALRTALAAAATDADHRAFLGTLRRLIAQLHDGHGNVSHRSDDAGYMPPFRWDWVEDHLVVTYVAPDATGPAQTLQPGQVILKIDGVPAATALARAEESVSAATVAWRRYGALYDLAGGTKESVVRLTVAADDGQERTIDVPRSAILGTVIPPRPDRISELRPGIFYVDIDRISDDDLEAAMPDLEQAKGIIFDFRGYPRDLDYPKMALLGHLTDTPLEHPRYGTPILTRPDREQMTFTGGTPMLVQPCKPRLTAKVVFIIAAQAISQAECYLGIVEHYHLGELVGEPTAGTNGNINPFVLPGGYYVTWTGLRVLKHDGSPHHGVGILPTVPVSRTIAGVAAGKDELLERAIDLLTQ